MRYFESKTSTYKNGKAKLFTLEGSNITSLVPYQIGNLFGLSLATSTKTIDDITLKTYYKELTRQEFFGKEITHIPVTYS